MKNRARRLWVVGLLGAAVFFAAVPAQATLFELTFWNEANLDNSTAKVTVDVTLDGGNTKLVISFVPGNFALTPLGIDQFGYQADSNSTTGTTDGFVFTSGGNMDGFGNFLRQDGKGGGTDLTITVIVLGDQTGALNSNEDFAAHVRFDGLGALGCSGFVGGTSTPTHAEEGCGAVPEPATLALLGSGLVSLGIFGRRKLKEYLAA